MDPQALFKRVATAPDPLKALDDLKAHITRAFVEGLNATVMETAQAGDLQPALRGSTWAVRAVEHLGDPLLKAHTLYNRGQIASAAGDFPEAERSYRAALPLYEGPGTPEDILDCAAGLIAILERRNNPSDLGAVASRAIDVALGEDREMSAEAGRGLVEIGRALRRAGEAVIARDCFDALRQLGEQLGDADYEAEACAQLAELAATNERFEEAADLYRRSIAVNERGGQAAVVAADLGNLGYVLYRLGRLGEAADAYGRSLELRDREGVVEGLATDLRHAYHVSHYLGRRDEALALFQRWAGASPAGPVQGVAQSYPLALDERGQPLPSPGHA